jgi:hypothetical protein
MMLLILFFYSFFYYINKKHYLNPLITPAFFSFKSYYFSQNSSKSPTNACPTSPSLRRLATWPEYKEPELKVFTCDLCNKELDIDEKDGVRKGYHVWWKMDDNTLAELHFHKDCASILKINE